VSTDTAETSGIEGTDGDKGLPADKAMEDPTSHPAEAQNLEAPHGVILGFEPLTVPEDTELAALLQP